MPDEYGRPNGEDFMKAARGLRDYRESAQKEDDLKGLGLGLDALDKDPNAAKPEGVSSIVWSKAQEQQGKGKAGAVLADQSRQALEESRLANEYMGKANGAGTPEERLNLLGQINPGTLAGAKALASVQKQVMGNQDNQVALLGSVLKKGQAEYDAVVRPALVAANDLANSGDEEGAGHILSKLSKVVPMRGEFRYNPDTKSMDHYHNERNAGLQPQAEGQGDASPGDGYAATGRSMSVRDALTLVGGMTKEDYALQMAAHRVANMEFNAKTLESGGHMGIDEDGKKVRVIPLINPNDSTRQFAVFDEATGTHRKTVGNDDFMNSGIRIVSKEQRALDNDERKVRLEEARLGLQREALGLKAGGGGGGQTLAEKYVGFVNKHESELAKQDPFSEPEARRKVARERALEEVRVLTGDENIRTEADVSAHSKPTRGAKKGGGQSPGGTRSPAPARGGTKASALLDSMLPNSGD